MKHGCYVLILYLLVVTIDVTLSRIVSTTYGKIRGTDFDTYNEFRGVPFAAPPVGSLRWQPPIEPKSWAPTILDTTLDSPGCIQNCSLPVGLCPVSTSEDCLYLNVFTPANIVSPLPVMVFIPGGQFEQGSAACTLYDGRFLVSYGVIVVVINYRLGALGWMTTGTIQPNLGLQDQRLALKWVQSNIGNFGGDPNQVTLFGESAGGSSVTAHLISPQSAGLFQRSIVQSNPVTLPYKDKSTAASVAEEFLNAVGCDGDNMLECLQKLSPNQILAGQAAASSWLPLLHPLQAGMPFIPVVDGNEIPMNAFQAFIQGKFQKIPTMWGSTSEEGIMFTYLALSDSMSTVLYYGVLLGIFHGESVDVGTTYPAPLFGDKRPLFSELLTDYIFNCPNRYIALRAFNNSNSPIHLYKFGHALSFDGWGSKYPFCVGHACHGSELPFVFGTATLSGFQITAQEVALTKTMMTYWTNFAKTSNPNTPITPAVSWPTIRSAAGITSVGFTQNGTAEVLVNDRTKYCDFWDSIGYSFGT